MIRPATHDDLDAIVAMSAKFYATTTYAGWAPMCPDTVRDLAAMLIDTGVMLVAASKRHLIMIDGITACAALLIASRIAPAVTDYCVFCRSTPHEGLDMALRAFQASALLDLGLDTMDGTGACLVWPLVQAATALLADPAQEDAAASRPASLPPGPGTAEHEPPRDEGEPTVPSELG